jgi:hypothetical protein
LNWWLAQDLRLIFMLFVFLLNLIFMTASRLARLLLDRIL